MYWIYRIFKDKGVRQRSSCITRQIQLLDVLFVEPLAHIGTEKEASPHPHAQVFTTIISNVIPAVCIDKERPS